MAKLAASPWSKADIPAPASRDWASSIDVLARMALKMNRSSL
jgi:hypothetical protein